MKVGSALRKHYAQLFGLLMLVLMATGWAPAAQAAPNCQAASATLSMPATVVVQPDEDLGPIDGAMGTATIIFNCSGLPASKAANDYTATIQAGQTLATLDSTNNTSGPGITFATSINGLAVLVTALPVQATSRSCLACGPTSTAGYVPGAVTAPSSAAVGSFSGTVTATYTAQLIKTKTTIETKTSVTAAVAIRVAIATNIASGSPMPWGPTPRAKPGRELEQTDRRSGDPLQPGIV